MNNHYFNDNYLYDCYNLGDYEYEYKVFRFSPNSNVLRNINSLFDSICYTLADNIKKEEMIIYIEIYILEMGYENLLSKFPEYSNLFHAIINDKIDYNNYNLEQLKIIKDNIYAQYKVYIFNNIRNLFLINKEIKEHNLDFINGKKYKETNFDQEDELNEFCKENGLTESNINYLISGDYDNINNDLDNSNNFIDFYSKYITKKVSIKLKYIVFKNIIQNQILFKTFLNEFPHNSKMLNAIQLNGFDKTFEEFPNEITNLVNELINFSTGIITRKNHKTIKVNDNVEFDIINEKIVDIFVNDKFKSRHYVFADKNQTLDSLIEKLIDEINNTSITLTHCDKSKLDLNFNLNLDKNESFKNLQNIIQKSIQNNNLIIRHLENSSVVDFNNEYSLNIIPYDDNFVELRLNKKNADFGYYDSQKIFSVKLLSDEIDRLNYLINKK